MPPKRTKKGFYEGKFPRPDEFERIAGAMKIIVDRSSVTDPGEFRLENDSLKRLQSDPKFLADACIWWVHEANLRVLNRERKIDQWQFHNLTRSLMAFAGLRNANSQLLWDFYVESERCLDIHPLF